MNSSKWSARSDADHGAWPRMVASQPSPPAPRPAVSRPSDTSSSVISSRAKGTGWRKLGEATIVPSRIVDVAIAAAVRVGTAANHGPSRKVRQAMWS